MQRICVTGDSGSGKSTLSRALAQALELPYLELDALYHQPKWTPLDAGEFRERVRAFAEQPRWVIDGNYSSVRGAVALARRSAPRGSYWARALGLRSPVPGASSQASKRFSSLL